MWNTADQRRASGRAGSPVPAAPGLVRPAVLDCWACLRWCWCCSFNRPEPARAVWVGVHNTGAKGRLACSRSLQIQPLLMSSRLARAMSWPSSSCSSVRATSSTAVVPQTTRYESRCSTHGLSCLGHQPISSWSSRRKAMSPRSSASRCPPNNPQHLEPRSHQCRLVTAATNGCLVGAWPMTPQRINDWGGKSTSTMIHGCIKSEGLPRLTRR